MAGRRLQSHPAAKQQAVKIEQVERAELGRQQDIPEELPVNVFLHTAQDDAAAGDGILPFGDGGTGRPLI